MPVLRFCSWTGIYYENNRSRMKYDEYSSGGRSGRQRRGGDACRHLVKDRMERTGMRWVLPSARAMLNTRATYLNDDRKTLSTIASTPNKPSYTQNTGHNSMPKHSAERVTP